MRHVIMNYFSHDHVHFAIKQIFVDHIHYPYQVVNICNSQSYLIKLSKICWENFGINFWEAKLT